MNKKYIGWISAMVCVLCIGLLCALNITNEEKIIQNYESIIEHALQSKRPKHLNMQKNTVDYYLTYGVGRTNSNQESSIFKKNQYQFVMNVDIYKAIIQNFYLKEAQMEKITKDENTFFFHEDTFTNYSGITNYYRIFINDIEDNEYLVYVEVDKLRFMGVTDLIYTDDMLFDILNIGFNSKIDMSYIVSNYSNKVASNKIERIDLFKQVYPESGSLLDMLDQEPDYFTENPNVPDEME